MTLASNDDDKARNPFFRIMNTAGKAQRGNRKTDATILALAFRSAHESSDVWACLRFERALNNYDNAGLSGYIDGMFADRIVDGEGFDDLEAIRTLAEDFLSAETEY